MAEGRCCSTEATEIYWLCQSLARALGRRWMETLAGIGLTTAQLEVLHVLWRQEGVPLHEIGKSLCCVSSNVTGLIDRMERDGLVVRSRESGDRRVVTVHLTEKGKNFKAQVESLPPCCSEMLNILSKEDLDLLSRLLQKAFKGLTQEGECASESCNCGVT